MCASLDSPYWNGDSIIDIRKTWRFAKDFFLKKSVCFFLAFQPEIAFIVRRKCPAERKNCLPSKCTETTSPQRWLQVCQLVLWKLPYCYVHCSTPSFRNDKSNAIPLEQCCRRDSGLCRHLNVQSYCRMLRFSLHIQFHSICYSIPLKILKVERTVHASAGQGSFSF